MTLHKSQTGQADPAANTHTSDVLRCAELNAEALKLLFAHYALSIEWVDFRAPIPGSHFGEPEAGLVGNILYLRSDTPVHSALHEACHYICMDTERREALHTDAGGDYDEENAVCYLSILLADQLENYNRDRMMQDMDRWGYTFRLGTAQQWFERDTKEVQDFLIRSNIIDQHHQPTWNLRE